MRKGRDEGKKNGKQRIIMMEIVVTTSLPVDRLSATDCNAAARAKANFNNYLFLDIYFFMLNDHVIWAENHQRKLYFFTGHLVQMITNI